LLAAALAALLVAPARAALRPRLHARAWTLLPLCGPRRALRLPRPGLRPRGATGRSRVRALRRRVLRQLLPLAGPGPPRPRRASRGVRPLDLSVALAARGLRSASGGLRGGVRGGRRERAHRLRRERHPRRRRLLVGPRVSGPGPPRLLPHALHAGPRAVLPQPRAPRVVRDGGRAAPPRRALPRRRRGAQAD